MHLKPGQKIVIASHNPGKIHEIAELVTPLGFEVISAMAMGIPEPEETGVTFVENSQLKARLICEATGLPSLADDSGLSVDALDGQPGVYSARWAEVTPGGERDFGLAYERIFESLDSQKSYPAQMNCVLTLAMPEGKLHSFEGVVHGAIALPPRGDFGFGYDPIFTPQDHTQTFAEMDPDYKNKISHRQHAFEKFLEFLTFKNPLLDK